MTATLLLLAFLQTPPPQTGRDAVDALEFPELEFREPEVGEFDLLGVTVFHLHDSTLPLVDIELVLTGGVARLGREALAPLTALPTLLRNGGTSRRSPEDVEREIDLLALQLGVGSGGGGTSFRVNVPRRRLDGALSLLAEMVLEPAFDPDVVDTWRRGEIERLRRRRTSSGSLAFSEFNRLMYGDGPTGWTLDESDLDPNAVSPSRLRTLHEQVACRDRLFVGISGDIAWPEAEPILTEFLSLWPECPNPLPPPPDSGVTGEPGVFLVPMDGSQSTIVAAHSSPVRLGDTEAYFATQVADFVLGSGGISSRILSRMRSQSGLVYQAASVWTTPIRQPGLIGGFASTSAENTVRTTRELVSVLSEFGDRPPTAGEIEDAIGAMSSGFVFAFDTPSSIVSRRLAYRLQGLPDDWLGRYLAGLADVEASVVSELVTTTIDASRLTILIAGDPDAFDPGLDTMGPVRVLGPDGRWTAGPTGAARPDGSPRFPR